MNKKPHPTHDLEWRDSSHYEYVCKKCNIADTPSGWGKLIEPCMADEKVIEALTDTPQKKLARMAWHFNEVGIYTKANYCHEIIDYINGLESKVRGVKNMATDEETRRKNIDELRVFFDMDEYIPNIGSSELVEVVVSFMKDYPNYVVTIEGHTDERGMREDNLKLGQKRASTVKNMMVESGIDTNRIKTISYGKERPEFPYSDYDSWRRNRRVVFVLTKGI